MKMVGKNLKKINETIDKFFANCIYKILDNTPKLLILKLPLKRVINEAS